MSGTIYNCYRIDIKWGVDLKIFDRKIGSGKLDMSEEKTFFRYVYDERRHRYWQGKVFIIQRKNS